MIKYQHTYSLTFTTYWANSADMTIIEFGDIFLIFPRKQVLIFHAIISIGDNLHEMSKLFFWEK